MFASDLGHWGVPDACAVFLRRGGSLSAGVTADDVKAFTRDNARAP